MIRNCHYSVRRSLIGLGQFMSLFAILFSIGCSESSKPERNKTTPPESRPATQDRGEKARGELLFSVAASTKNLVESLVDNWAEKDIASVKINAGPSNGLATQILAGAPADLFLSANQLWADKLTEAGQDAKSVRLLTNRLVLVVPRGNPGGVLEPKDLLSEKVKKIALAGEKVPAGIYADQALTKLELNEKLQAAGKIARGQDVRSALSFVERNEAEAGIVYSTDVGESTGIEAVYEFDPKLHDEIVYVLVLLKNGSTKPSAEKLFQYLHSPAAEPVYKKFGFSRITGK